MSAEVMTAPAMTEEQAERITEQIAFRIDSITENYEVVMSLMRDALARNAHEALGYASPGAYIADRFGQSLQTLGAALRREFVHELSDAGLSTRAIAPVFDVSHVQISKDLKTGVNPVNTSTESVEYEGITANPSTGEVIDMSEEEFMDSTANLSDDEFEAAIQKARAEGDVSRNNVVEHTVTEKVKAVTGLDGKTYKRVEPAAPRAEAITSQFTSAIADLNRVMARIRRISEDKNFVRNKEQIASLHASDLYRTISELETLAETLKGN